MATFTTTTPTASTSLSGATASTLTHPPSSPSVSAPSTKAVTLISDNAFSIEWRPGYGSPLGRHGAGFHSRAVPSPSALASSLPPGLNATPGTPLRAPVRMRVPTRWPVAVLHSRTVPLESLLASSLPLGLNATADTPWAPRTGGSTTTAGPHAPGAAGQNAADPLAGIPWPRTDAAVAAAEEAAAWCGPARAASAPTSTPAAANPATTHTHRGGWGQPPNSVTSPAGTS